MRITEWAAQAVYVAHYGGCAYPGDEITRVVHKESREIQRTNVRTRLGSDSVLLETSRIRLDYGLNYSARLKGTVPASNVRMTVENSGYIKQ